MTHTVRQGWTKVKPYAYILPMKHMTHKSLTVCIGPAAASFSLAGKVVATARKGLGCWGLRVPGHNWPVTADMPTAKFAAVPGDKITSVPVKAFKSWKACADEVIRLTA